MDNIKILRLQSGEDIIAETIEDSNGYFILKNPFVIFTKRNGEVKTSVFLVPWLPIDIIEQNVANIFMSDVMTMMIPTMELIDYYTRMLLEVEMDDYSLLSSDEDTTYVDDEDDFMEEDIEPIEVQGNKTVH
jgi:hypothetical protein